MMKSAMIGEVVTCPNQIIGLVKSFVFELKVILNKMVLKKLHIIRNFACYNIPIQVQKANQYPKGTFLGGEIETKKNPDY